MRRTLLDHGRVSELLYDTLHGGAFETGSTGNAFRGMISDFRYWFRFLQPPSLAPSTLALEARGGGDDAELLETARDGVWIQQIGWSSPDPLTSAFGGEIRVAYRIRNGRIAEPVRGGTVGGLTFAPIETPSLLGSLRTLGSTPALVGHLLAPPMVVDGLTVSGEG